MNKAVIFDMFGVLYPDTFWGLADQYLPKRSPEVHQQLRDIVARSDRGHLSQKEFWELSAEVFGISYEELTERKKTYGGINKDLLSYVVELKSRGVKTGLLSNVGRGFIASAISPERQQLLFDSVVLSGEVGCLKPSPEIYGLAVEQLELPARNCLFFDDIQRHVDGALAAGLQSHLYIGLEDCKKVTEKFLEMADTDK